jgi:DNA-directed RNA polymerase subunit M/transcription elongation factor TFIIS
MEDHKCKETKREFPYAIPLPVDPFYTDIAYTGLRKLKCILLANKLGQIDRFLELSYEAQIDIIKYIENSCLNETIRKAREYNIRCVWPNIQFENIYHSICYNILTTLDIKSGTGSLILVKKIFDGDIDLNTIASLSCKELCPEKYEEIIEKIDRRCNTKQSIKATTLYFCRKCKRNQCSAERVQNRSNDESSSFYITCLFCGNKWFG